VFNFIANDAAQFGINLLLILTVTDAAKIEIGAVADVELVIV